MQDYLAQNERLAPFYNRHDTIENFIPQISEKEKHDIDRSLLVEVLNEQYKGIELSEDTENNISSLSNKKSFTVTTGHQLCLFSGPLYCIYKILSAINLSEKLKEKYPSYHFVPMFWMASEDHDFEEVNHIHLFGKKIEWKTSQSGAVGRMNLSEIGGVLDNLLEVMGKGENADKMYSLLEKAYSKENSLAQASRIFLNALFKDYGLVIIDGDDARLKKQITPLIKQDVNEKKFYSLLQDQSTNLGEHYKVQAHVREINFFTLKENKRQRIDTSVEVPNIDKQPEKFSPNVLMRPLYQESILPNIAYVGGGAEIAYWMQLKSVFDSENIPFPILVLRNSALIISEKHNEKLKKLRFSSSDLFNSEQELHSQYIARQKDVKSIDNELEQFDSVFEKIKSTYSAPIHQQIIEAEQQRHRKSLDILRKKLDKIEKQKHKSALDQISKIKQHYFPNNGLQERHENLITFYLKYGDNFIKKMKKELNPLDSNFVVLAL